MGLIKEIYGVEIRSEAQMHDFKARIRGLKEFRIKIREDFPQLSTGFFNKIEEERREVGIEEYVLSGGGILVLSHDLSACGIGQQFMYAGIQVRGFTGISERGKDIQQDLNAVRDLCQRYALERKQSMRWAVPQSDLPEGSPGFRLSSSFYSK
jgi:hypothetical protein